MDILVKSLVQEIVGSSEVSLLHHRDTFGFKRPDCIICPSDRCPSEDIEFICGIVHESFHMYRFLGEALYYKVPRHQQPLLLQTAEEWEVKRLSEIWIKDNIHRFSNNNSLLRARVINDLCFSSSLFNLEKQAEASWYGFGEASGSEKVFLELSTIIDISEDEISTCLDLKQEFELFKKENPGHSNIFCWSKARADRFTMGD
jgi:hypothetical protein